MSGRDATMPRSVVAAVVAGVPLAVIAAVNVGISLLALVGAVPGSVKAPVPLPGDEWFLAWAVLLIIGTLRRDPRVRLPVFWANLGGAVLLGTVLAAMLLAGSFVRAFVGPSFFAGATASLPALSGFVLVVSCNAVIAYALSRPSAKVWFAPAAAA